ncbi:MAG: LytTR family transcriptional regulator, partial [Bacteroidetes bacterium]
PLPCLQFHKGKRHYQIALSDILFLHSDHVYVEIHTLHHQKILCRSPLKCLLAQLPAEQFVQTHRSYIVNLQHVSRLEKDALYVRDTPIPISRSRRKAVLASLYDD